LSQEQSPLIEIHIPKQWRPISLVREARADFHEMGQSIPEEGANDDGHSEGNVDDLRECDHDLVFIDTGGECGGTAKTDQARHLANALRG